MSILVGLLAKQIMRHSELSTEAGKQKYRQLFAQSKEYAGIKPDVDQILIRCGYEQIVCDTQTDNIRS